MMLLYWFTKLLRTSCEAVSAPLIAMVFAAAVVPIVSDWLAFSLVEVSVMEPSEANDADNPRPADVSAALKASIELTLPAATTLLIVIVVAAPVAGVKIKVLACSELVPALVRSAA